MLKIIALFFGIIFLGCSSSADDNKSNNNTSTAEKQLTSHIWDEDRKINAIKSCTLPGNPRDYCECSVSILQTIFTYTEFIEFDRLLRSGARPSDEIVAKMIEMQRQIKELCGLPNPIR